MAASISDSTPTPNVEHILRGWRSKSVGIVLWVITIAALPTVLSGVVFGASRDKVTIVMLIVYLAIVAVACARHADYRLRGSTLIVAGFVMAANSLTRFGLEGSGRGYLIVLPIIAFILVGVRAGWVATGVSMLTYAVFSFLANNGMLAQWLDPAYNRLDMVMWATTGLTTVMLLITVVALFMSMYRFLLSALKSERAASAELLQTYDATLEGWAHALELRDLETAGHCRRVSDVATRLAGVTGVPHSGLHDLYRGSLLHDVGKIGVPDRILLKPGKLTDDELQRMQAHTTYAYELLVHIPFLLKALDIPYCHHEKWDGTGYPRGLKGEQIPLLARVFSVVDVYDALTSERCYRPAWPREKALEYIRQHAGSEFDPLVVEAFLDMAGRESPRMQPAH
ncbi:MAG: HD domain-containing protein [Dehalococcoidia bacterium]|jgi:HD-GYP domain-containing protein (c-di-GMP phosphodiesterase class II)|nr:HD domain-containing protein [Dehalococcoidia bacterium]